MDLAQGVIDYIRANPERFREAVWVHLRLSGSALLLAILLFVPLGVLASRSARLGPTLVGAVASFRVVPSIAVLFLAYPWLGLGYQPALVALTILAGPPLVINTDAGLRNVEPAVLESASGLGMNIVQVFTRVQLPLALPVIIAGIRTAAVEIVASAPLAAIIGAGGLGTFIFSGITLLDVVLILVGTIPVMLMILAVEVLLGGVERQLATPTG